MSVLFDNASSEYLQVDAAYIDFAPLTFACWFYSDDLAANQALISIADRFQTDQVFMLMAEGSFSGDPIRAFAFDGGVDQARTSTGYSANTWHHACAVFASTTSRSAYIDGGSKVTDTGLNSPNISTRGTSIGRVCDSTPGAYMSGRICEAGIWNVALSDAEVAILAAGYAPPFVQPGNLRGYYRMRNLGDLMDVVGDTGSMTAFNTPTSADHCRIIYPSSPHVRYEQTVAPVIWIRVGRRFLFTSANWGARTYYFEATLRRQGGTARAKLYDLTDSVDVVNSEISTTSGTMIRVRSSAITLTDGHEYEARLGATSVDEGRSLGAGIMGLL